MFKRLGIYILCFFVFFAPIRAYAFVPLLAGAASVLSTVLLGTAWRSVAIYAGAAGGLSMLAAYPGAYGELRAEWTIKGALLSALIGLPEASAPGVCNPDYGYRTITASWSGSSYSSSATCYSGIQLTGVWSTSFCSQVNTYSTNPYTKNASNSGVLSWISSPATVTSSSTSVTCTARHYDGTESVIFTASISQPSTPPATTSDGVNNLVSNPNGNQAVEDYMKANSSTFSPAVGGTDMPISGIQPAPGNYQTPVGDVVSVASDGSMTVNSQPVADGTGVYSGGSVSVDASTGAPVVNGQLAQPTSATITTNTTNTTTTQISGTIDVTGATWIDPPAVQADARTFASIFDAHRLTWNNTELVQGINHLFPSSGSTALPALSVTLMGHLFTVDFAQWQNTFDTIYQITVVIASLYSIMIILGRDS